MNQHISIVLTVPMALFDRTRLEMLNLNQNRLVSVVGLSSLPGLIVLNLGKSSLTYVTRLIVEYLKTALCLN